MSLPVTLITQYISTYSDLNLIGGRNLDVELYGYFALKNDITVNYSGYNGTSLQAMRQSLKVNCQAVGYNYFVESITINYLHSKWGI